MFALLDKVVEALWRAVCPRNEPSEPKGRGSQSVPILVQDGWGEPGQTGAARARFPWASGWKRFSTGDMGWTPAFLMLQTTRRWSPSWARWAN